MLILHVQHWWHEEAHVEGLVQAACVAGRQHVAGILVGYPCDRP